MTIDDSMWCGSLGASGAACYWSFSNNTQTMNLQQFAIWWNDPKDPKVATSVSTLISWKAAIEKLCTIDSGECTEAVQSNLAIISSKIDAIIALSKRAK